MVIYLCDASSVLRYVDNEAGMDRVKQILRETAQGTAKALVSAIHWGEVAGKLYQRLGEASMQKGLALLEQAGFEIIAAHPNQAIRAGILKKSLGVPYADAFGIALAEEYPNSILITADFDFKLAAHLISIEFLPQKP